VGKRSVGGGVCLQGHLRGVSTAGGTPEGAKTHRSRNAQQHHQHQHHPGARGVEKRGLVEELESAGLASGKEAWHSDEMRLGLRGQTRKVLAPKGVKVVQPLQLVYEYSYLILALSPLTGEIKWEWIERMNQEQIRPVLEKWALEAVVWDRAPSHRAHSLSELETARVFLPSYSPELDPAERIFEEIRRHVEGKVYESVRAKQKEAERYLKELKADPERVKSLCCWEWLREALESLATCAGNP
jgi:transposase